MKWGRQFDQFADSFSDRLNPLLVKEVRQALKGRLFLLTFGLLLLGAWVVSAFGVTAAGDAIQWQSSPTLLASYITALQIAVVGLVPFIAFRSMQAEAEANTWELVCITTLSPRRLVGGKLGSAVVQMLLLASVISPCVAFCSLLPGFDLIVTLTALSVTLVLSLLNTIFSVMLSSLASTRYWQNFAMGALLLLLIGETKVVCELTYFSVTGQNVVESVLSHLGRFSPGSTFLFAAFSAPPSLMHVLAVSAFLVVALAYFFLFYEITIAQVTFEADSRSGRIRVACSLLYVMQWGLLVLCDTHRSDFIENPALVLFVIHWLVFGLSACLESETISTRIRRQLPGWSLLRLPYLPGGSRAMVFLLLHLGSAPIIATLVTSYLPNFYSGQRVSLWSMYLLVYITIAVASCRSILALNPAIRRANLRVGVAIGIFLSMLPSVVLSQMFENVRFHFFFLTIFNPFEYSTLQDGQTWALVTPIMIVVLIGVHLNWEILKRSVQDVTPVDLPDSGHWLHLPPPAKRSEPQ